ncbi:GTPase-activating protein GYP1-like [Pyrus ussuriensis x Pyrus communis]|uniref:GTPase-activating protein GYP1-like n=1 Tax=Pyrus ussuriensis x Pyrus communis TaxID=2448454 RepID=A0A5N5FVK9_9ROSA|nr:GTPase-activating protein GYP1-like [Pyrus ussuriensis x Pyrus communis]
MNKKSNQSSDREENHSRKESAISTPDSRFNQTLRNVQGLLKGRSIPGKVLLTRRSNLLDPSKLQVPSPNYERSLSFNDAETSDRRALEEDGEGLGKPSNNANSNKLTSSTSNVESISKGAQKSTMGARATDSARVMKFTKVLSGTTVILEKLRELAWSGIPPYMRPDIWRLLLGYAPSNSDRREGVLRRKRLEYLDCVAQYYDIPDTERSDDEINMLRQIAVDCPRTVPDVSFLQQEQVQKSLERILYTWAIRHPASGYVQGINDLVTPFLVVFLSEYLEGSVDNWSISDLSPDKISNIEADCYWCLSNLLEGMQDHYTFAQPGIQRLVFKLKEVVRRIDEPVSRHVEEQGLEFLQFAFRWFNCLLIREIPFNLISRLWDTYLAEGDALPDFLVYIFASFLLTWSEELQKLDFQELVMFLQHLPTHNWTHQELEMVLSRAFMWHKGYKFYVGGKEGWVVNPFQSYSLWAEKNRFNINDTLHFKYKKGSDSVLVVNKDDYFSCNTQNPIQKLDGGDSDFTLDRSGPFYFISGQNGNCQKGQKLLVIVLAPRHPKPPVLPPPTTSPTAPPQPYHPPAASPPQGPGLPPAVGGPVPLSPSPVITTPPSASPGPGSSQPSPSPSTSPVPTPSTNTPTSSPVPAPASGYTPTTSPPAPPTEGPAPTPSGVPGGPTPQGSVTSPPAPPPEVAAPTPSGVPGGATPTPSGQPAGPTPPGTVTSPPPGSQEATAPSNNGALRGVADPSIVLVSLAVVLVSVALS